MTRALPSFWLVWALLLATLGLWPVLPALIGHRADPWYAAQIAVAGFVLALLAVAAGVGTFALRESLLFRDAREGRLDPRTPEGVIGIRRRLTALWGLCAAIGALGGILIWYADRVALGLPYLAGAAALFVIHAPWPHLFARVRAGLPAG